MNKSFGAIFPVFANTDHSLIFAQKNIYGLLFKIQPLAFKRALGNLYFYLVKYFPLCDFLGRKGDIERRFYKVRNVSKILSDPVLFQYFLNSGL